MATYTLRRKRQKLDPTRRLLSLEESRELYVGIGRAGLTIKQVGERLGRGHHTVSSWLQRESTIEVSLIPRLREAILG
jgi:IS30 family transposase